MYLDFVIPFEDARRAAMEMERQHASAEAGAAPTAHEHHHDEPTVRAEYRLEASIADGHFAQAA